LFFAPTVVPFTVTLKLHDALPASVAPAKVMLPDAATAVIVPPPQVPTRPFGVWTTSPAGNVSVKPTPVRAVAALGLAMVKLSEVAPLSGMLAAPKLFAIVGGAVAAVTVTLAVAVPPLPPSTEVTAEVVLTFAPAVVPVTLTLKLHDAAPARVAPPGDAAGPGDRSTCRRRRCRPTVRGRDHQPAGKVSVKPTPSGWRHWDCEG
jgi:hypothetical protein